MTIASDLLASVQTDLGALVNHQVGSSSLADVFEAYFFALVVRAARTEGAAVTYHDVHYATPTQFVFRTSPGHIWSDQQPYCFALLSFPGKAPLEAHVGIFVEGKSRVFHEADVAVLYSSEAADCRANRITPRAPKVILSCECKFYSARIPLHLARAFLGLATDIQKEERFFLVNTESPTVERLLAHHRRQWEHRLYPSSATEARVVSQFQEAFKRFKAMR